MEMKKRPVGLVDRRIRGWEWGKVRGGAQNDSQVSSLGNWLVGGATP